ncbi:ataxin-2-like protein isoform X2 [Crassostrea angulata]|uniref:ataxin-2-like protein isoform X2 n=1 Tax=Magallana angulata TaxID=2784310 RepID=UPI0022B0CDDD|nr:ataxin-2-like protein isoform X2 [Crassostrea angulata]
MMSVNANRRKNRQNSGPSLNRNNRPRGYDKNISFEGIYSNSRFSHLLASLVGCVVQLQVKNGGVYDGILKTNSPRMDVVLEMAHKHEESSNNNTNNTTPSKDRLIEKVIFNMSDILSINVVDVDLDYAVKDTFTDSAISSKCNSNHTEADMKVLQPWEGGEGEELGGLERESSNGWDPNDMFKTNEEKFNVQTKYDDSLTQYTTPLEKRDTKEFKNREEEAERLANEIERSDQYKQHISLENGEGDEEEKFSAVKRVAENNTTSMQSSGNTGKYVHPNKRSGMQGNRSRGGYMSNTRPPNQIPPRWQNQHHHHHQHNFHQNPPAPPHHHPPHHQTSTEEPRLNGSADDRDRRSEDRKTDDSVERDKRPEDKRPEEKKSEIDTNVKSSPKQDPVTQHVAPEKPDPVPHTSPVGLKPDRRSSGPKPRDRAEVIKDLKEFNSNFKVSFDSKKEEMKEASEAKTKQPPVPAAPSAESQAQIVTGETTAPEVKATKQQGASEREANIDIKKSNLNPLAKEFVMGKGREQVATPPLRPQTQSPVAPGIMQPISQPISQPMHQYTYTVMPPMPQGGPQPANQNYKPIKRAVVSVGPQRDLTAAAAQAATGQPLFNQATVQAAQPNYIQYIPNYQAVMPMPAATGRMVTPTSMPMVPTSHGAQSSQSHQHSIFMPGQAQPMPAHLPTAQFPYPAHMPMATNNMGNQASQQGGQPQPITHPAPSPVQQHGNSQSHQQGRPPNSGTPQPPGGPYPHMAPTNIQGHPPLIPSPQNQSPQTMHNPYPYVSQHPIFQPGTTGHLYTQQHMPTSGNQTMHTGPSQQINHGAQIVVMPNPQPGQVQHHPHNQQFQQHMGGPNQQHMMQPGMPTGYQGSNPNNVVHPFVQQVASAPPPPQVATVPPFQQNH